MSVSINRKDFKRREPKTAMQKRLRYYYKGGRQLYRDVQALKSLINVEYKFKDSSGTVATIGNTSATATYILLNGLTKGDNANNRNGSSVKIVSLQMHLRFALNSAGISANTLEQNTVRCCLVQSTYPQTLAPTLSGGTPQSIFINDTTYAFRDLNNRSNFRILKDWRINLTADGSDVRTIPFFRKFKNFHTLYNNLNNGDITDINKNALYLIIYCSSGLAAPNDTQAYYATRIRYIDN